MIFFKYLHIVLLWQEELMTMDKLLVIIILIPFLDPSEVFYTRMERFHLLIFQEQYLLVRMQ